VSGPAQIKLTNRKRKRPVALRLTDVLREEILGCEPGVFLGREPDLLKKYGVSRPTFRQITRMLQQEQLLAVRRGSAGGYYTSSPALETVGRAATNYLRRRHTTPEHLHQAASLIAAVLARQAAMSENEAARAELAAHRRILSANLDRRRESAELMADEMLFGAKVAQLADNPALELQLSILYQVAFEQMRIDSRPMDPEGQRAFHIVRIRLADAILDREPEVAAALSQRATELVGRWSIEQSLPLSDEERPLQRSA
jgi:GntR family transcriptional regulator, transcriptional repressor for pyruvate dehydrogenase complex